MQYKIDYEVRWLCMLNNILTLKRPLEEKISNITDNLCLGVPLLLNFLQQVKSDGIEVLMKFSHFPGNHGKLGHWHSLAMPLFPLTAKQKILIKVWPSFTPLQNTEGLLVYKRYMYICCSQFVD